MLTGIKQGTVHVTMTLGGVTFTQEVEVIGAETYDVTLNILEGKWQAWDTTFFNQNNSYKLNRYKEGTWNIAVTNHDSLSLITPNEVKSNYNKWGYDSANSKIALVLYNIDGDETVLGAGSTVTDFRGIRLYNAAAYNCQEDRTFTITLTQVEDENQIIVLNVTIPGVTSKTLDVTVSINQPTVTLEQQNTIATTDVQTFTNNTAYPVTIAMNSVEAKTDEGNTELTVVKKERDFGEDDSLLTEGVALGVMLADESEDNMIYYDPDDSQENTSFDTMVGTSLEDVGETKFQYFIEYGTNYASFAKVRQFGYDITFSVAVSRDDVEVPAQSEDEE